MPIFQLTDLKRTYSLRAKPYSTAEFLDVLVVFDGKRPVLDYVVELEANLLEHTSEVFEVHRST